MPPENTAAVEKPTDEQLVDAKPGLSDEEKAALAAEDDAGVGKTEVDEVGDSDNPPQDPGSADSTDGADTGSIDEKFEYPEVARGAAANVELLPTRNVDMQAVGQRLDQIDVDQKTLDKKFDDEDLPIKDYLSESRSLTKEQSILESDIREAHFVQNANRSMASTDWQRSVNSFVDLNPDFSSAIMQGALNAALNELYADETNLGSSHNWYLQIAARAVIEHISPAQAASEALPDGNDNDAAVNAAKGAATRSNDAKAKLPKTLGDLAPADEVGTEKGKFDDLDSLSGVELEARLSLMTPEQEQEYLRAE